MKSLSKQDVGKSRTKSKVSNGLCSIWERKLYVLSGNSTSEVTEKRSAHITAPRPVWLNRSSCVYILGYNSHSHLSSPGKGGGGKHLISPKNSLLFVFQQTEISQFSRIPRYSVEQRERRRRTCSSSERSHGHKISAWGFFNAQCAFFWVVFH